MSKGLIEKKTKKILLSMLFIICIASRVLGTVESVKVPKQSVNSGMINSNLVKSGNTAWGTIRFASQVISVGALVLIGTKYMFASADQKADLKNALVAVIIGVVLVFGATIVIWFSQDLAGQVFIK